MFYGEFEFCFMENFNKSKTIISKGGALEPLEPLLVRGLDLTVNPEVIDDHT